MFQTVAAAYKFNDLPVFRVECHTKQLGVHGGDWEWSSGTFFDTKGSWSLTDGDGIRKYSQCFVLSVLGLQLYFCGCFGLQ